MLINFKPKKQTHTSAKVVDGKLILSLPDALTPVVWQMDLAHAKASALEVLHNEAMSAYTLTLKTPKGETIEVAAFDERENAVEGLMAASAALENAHGLIRGHETASAHPANDGGSTGKKKKTLSPAQKKQKKNRWITSILALVILFILFSIWVSVIPRKVTVGGPAPESIATSTSPQESSGVPVSADDFLRGQ